MAVVEEKGTESLQPNNEELVCDYFVVGAGIQSLAFVDELTRSNKTCSVIIADARGAPGGRWVDAPEFARLDQPCALWGVSTNTLTGYLSCHTPEKSDEELPRQGEIVAYCNYIMQKFIATERIRYFPSCIASADADGAWMTSVHDLNRTKAVHVRNKVVTSTIYGTKFSHASWVPPFDVMPGIKLIPPRGLPYLTKAYARYVVIGAGKIGRESILWLLQNHVKVDKVYWVVPHEEWLINLTVKPNKIYMMAEVAAKIKQVADMENFLASKESWCHLDKDIQPETFKASDITDEELHQLRQVKNVIRKGYVRAVLEDGLFMEHGSVAMGPNTLYINCAGSSFRSRPEPVPIWTKRFITLQYVGEVCDLNYNESFCGALIGRVEASWHDDPMCHCTRWTPVSRPYSTSDMLQCLMLGNTDRHIDTISTWRGLRAWLFSSRPSPWSVFTPQVARIFGDVRYRRIQKNLIKNLAHVLQTELVLDADDPEEPGATKRNSPKSIESDASTSTGTPTNSSARSERSDSAWFNFSEIDEKEAIMSPPSSDEDE